MRTWFTVRCFVGSIVSVGMCTLCLGATGHDPALERLVDLGTVVRSQSVWTARYRQEYTPSGMTMGEIVEGTVWISWPDRALFATGEPVERWMGLAGLDVRLLDLENGTCDDHQLSVEEWERIPLVAVLEPEKAIGQFVVEAKGEHGLSLTPRAAGGVDKVTVEIGPGGLPLEVIVHDPQGATSAFDFQGWQPSEGPPGGAWLPQPPEDLTCLSD